MFKLDILSGLIIRKLKTLRRLRHERNQFNTQKISNLKQKRKEKTQNQRWRKDALPIQPDINACTHLKWFLVTLLSTPTPYIILQHTFHSMLVTLQSQSTEALKFMNERMGGKTTDHFHVFHHTQQHHSCWQQCQVSPTAHLHNTANTYFSHALTPRHSLFRITNYVHYSNSLCQICFNAAMILIHSLAITTESILTMLFQPIFTHLLIGIITWFNLTILIFYNKSILSFLGITSKCIREI